MILFKKKKRNKERKEIRYKDVHEHFSNKSKFSSDQIFHPRIKFTYHAWIRHECEIARGFLCQAVRPSKKKLFIQHSSVLSNRVTKWFNSMVKPIPPLLNFSISIPRLCARARFLLPSCVQQTSVSHSGKIGGREKGIEIFLSRMPDNVFEVSVDHCRRVSLGTDCRS